MSEVVHNISVQKFRKKEISVTRIFSGGSVKKDLMNKYDFDKEERDFHIKKKQQIHSKDYHDIY